MAASVRIEDEAFADERYEDLALYAGLSDADHARGKMARIWRQCTIEGTHTIENHLVIRVLGQDGIDALVRSRLGEKISETHVRIRGTEGRIEWLRRLRENGNKGGRPKGSTTKPSGSRGGKPSGSENRNPPAPAPAPAPIDIAPPSADAQLALSPPEAKTKSEYQEAVSHFDARFSAAYGTRPTWGAKQGAQINRLLKLHGLDEFKRRTDILFDSPPDYLTPPFDLGTLDGNFDRLVTAKPSVKPKFPKMRKL